MVWSHRNQLKIPLVLMAIGFLLCSTRLALAGQNSAVATVNPTIESVSDTFAFIRWVTGNPGGTTLHYAFVQYGTNPNHLDRTAKSPTRINPAHSDMIFRVSVNDLSPGTTYYYRVFSQQANGAYDPGTSTINTFTTQATNEKRNKQTPPSAR